MRVYCCKMLHRATLTLGALHEICLFSSLASASCILAPGDASERWGVILSHHSEEWAVTDDAQLSHQIMAHLKQATCVSKGCLKREKKKNHGTASIMYRLIYDTAVMITAPLDQLVINQSTRFNRKGVAHCARTCVFLFRAPPSSKMSLKH